MPEEEGTRVERVVALEEWFNRPPSLLPLVSPVFPLSRSASFNPTYHPLLRLSVG